MTVQLCPFISSQFVRPTAFVHSILHGETRIENNLFLLIFIAQMDSFVL